MTFVIRDMCYVNRDTLGGYRITAIMARCQQANWGSTPHTRKSKPRKNPGF